MLIGKHLTISVARVYAEFITFLKSFCSNNSLSFLIRWKNLHYSWFQLVFTFELSLDSFPDKRKSSLIRPILISSNRPNIINYRPYSVLHTIPKFFERFLYKYIFKTRLNEQNIVRSWNFTVTKLETILLFYSICYVEGEGG